MVRTVRVRAMREEDVDEVAAVRVRGWQAAYAGMVPQRHLDALSVEEDAAARRTWFAASRERVCSLVAVDADDAVVGWAALGAYRGAGAPDGAGELYALYARPDAVGTGVGRALMGAVHEEAARRGFADVLLWVLRDNARARRFYERAGYAADGAEQSEDYDGVPVVEVRYGRTAWQRGDSGV
jgi:L-amino acid N-acyltransferase YncA